MKWNRIEYFMYYIYAELLDWAARDDCVLWPIFVFMFEEVNGMYTIMCSKVKNLILRLSYVLIKLILPLHSSHYWCNSFTLSNEFCVLPQPVADNLFQLLIEFCISTFYLHFLYELNGKSSIETTSNRLTFIFLRHLLYR